MTPAVLTPGGFRPVFQPRRGRLIPFRRRGLGDTPQTFQQALAATGWVPGQPIPYIPTPPGGWPDINPATGAVIVPAAPVVANVVGAAAGGSSGDQMGQAVTPAPAAPAAATPVQPAGAPSPVPTVTASATSFLSQTFLGFPVWMWGTAAVVGFFIFQQDKGHYGR